MASMEKTLTENSYKSTNGVGNTTTTTTTTTASTTNPTTNPVNSSNNKWQMEVLMERLRSKAGSLQSLTDSAKAVKTAIANKLHILDPNERAVLGRCLDNLQHNIKVTTLPAMVERLEATAKQLGLKFTAGTSGFEVYISCDMFYVEVVLDPDGKVKDVKVELAGDQNTQEGQSSPELVDCLSRGDFNDFTTHLEGFAAIYQLSADKKSKSKAYQSLQALETDLIKLYELAQATLTDPYKIVLKSPVGLLQGRKGGHPMRLVFFVSPYELLDVNAGKAVTLTSDSVASFNLKHYVMVTIDASTSHKLQSTTLMNLTKGTDGKPLPVFSGLTGGNSISLPACFTLKLKKPMPVSLALVRKINELTGIECADLTNQQPLLSLIVHDASDGELDCNNNRGLFVTLPDQQHCYFVTSGGDFPGVMVSGVHFTHPTHITTVLMHLRAQAAFNALIASCVRPESKQDLDSAIMFEVTAVSHEYVSITFEHPQEESTATAEIDLTDLCNVRCRLHTLSAEPAFCSDEYATKVIQRCLSIPVTMRAVMRKVAREEKKEVHLGGDTTVMMGGGKFSSDLNQNKFLLNEYDKLGMRRDQLGVPTHNLSHVVANSAAVGYGNYPHGGGSNDMTSNPLAALGNAVQEAGTPLGYGALMGAVGQKQQQLATQQQPSSHFLADAKPAKVRKRKPTIDLDGKSPKYGDDIIIDIDDRSMDMNDSSMNETSKLRDIRHNFVAKRRQSSDGDSTSDLAALREQVYGAGCAANMAKLGPFHPKDPKDVKKIKKQRSEGSAKEDTRKSPIVLDLTENDNSSKKNSGHSTSLSAQLLKRPGIEIIPIPGSNTPISIPSSITVTPVMKSAEDKYRDKKDRRDKKDLDKKDKKRKRDDSPSSGSSGSNKASKVQIISSGLKTSSLTSIERIKSESGKLSGLTMKPSTPYQSSPSKKPSHLSSGMSKPGLPSKVSLSPNQKPSKVIYSPTHNSGGNTSSSSSSSSSPKNISSPKHTSASPKHPSMSPKHTSLGKPSMTTLKSASPTFSKPSLSPKLSKNKEKERSSSSSPSRPSSTSSSSSSSSSPSLSSKHKTSSSSSSSSSSVHSSSASEKLKANLSDALTITKVSTGETSSSSSLATSLLAASSSQSKSHSAPSDKPSSFSLDKSKTSPPKNNKKGSSLSDIVEKLRGQVGTSEALTIEKRDKDRKEIPKSSSSSSEVKKETDKKTEFIVKQSSGSLKLTINKTKKEASLPKSSSSPSSKPTVSKSSSGLKQGISGGPASSRKISSPKVEGPKPISSLPPIPKLPPSSVSNVTATAVSPLGTTLPIAQTSPHQYQRDRGKEKDYKDKEKSSLSDRPKSKESISSSSSKSSVSSSSNSTSSGGSSTSSSSASSNGSVGGISSSVLTKKEGSNTSCSNNSSSSSNNKSLPMSKPPIKEERVSSQQQQSTTSSSTSSSNSSSSRNSGSGLGSSNSNSNSTSNSATTASSSSSTCKENADSVDCGMRNMFPASHCEPPTDKLDKTGSTKAEADSTHSSTSHVTSGHDDKPESTDRQTNSLSSSQTLNNSTSKSTLPPTSYPSSSSVSDSARPRESSSSLSSYDITKDEAKNKSGDAIQKVRPPSSLGAVSSTSSSLSSMPAPASPSTDKTSSENSVTTGNYQGGSAPVTSASQQPTATSTTCAPTPSSMRLPQLDAKDLKPTLSPVPSDAPVDKISKLSESVNASHILPLVPQPLSKPPTPNMANTFPPSPSTVSIKIVKSPAPVNSPLNLISPHSVTSQPSPCIADDDDLMDEALMGTRK